MENNLEALVKADVEKTKVKQDKLDFNEVVSEARFHFLPLLSVAFFALIIFVAVIPNVQKIFGTIDEIDSLKNKDKDLNARITRFEELKAQNTQMQAIIDKINVIVPTGNSEVVKFRDRISTTADLNKISLESSKSGETLTIVSQLQTGNFGIIEIPSEFNMGGPFSGFRNFLNGLYQGTDFFVVNEMALSGVKSTTEDQWQGQLNLVKYQFFTEEGFDPTQVYATISENDNPDQSVIDFLQSKFIDNVINSNPTSP